MEPKRKENKDNKIHTLKKPLPVRQTLASKYRMLKGNAILKYEIETKFNATINNNEKVLIPPLKTLVAVLDSELNATISSNCISNTTLKTSKIPRNPKKVQTQPKVVEKKPPPQRESLHPNFHRMQYNLHRDAMKGQGTSQQTQKLAAKSSGKTVNNKSFASIENFKKPLNIKTASTKDLRPQKYTTSTLQKPKSVNIVNTQPNWIKNNLKKTENKDLPKTENVTKLNTTKPAELKLISNNTVKENLCKPFKINSPDELKNIAENKPVLTTPNRQKHLSVLNNTKQTQNIFTPSNSINRQTIFATPGSKRQGILSKPESEIISEKLNDWLIKRGKSIGAFPHLKCFGVQAKEILKNVSEIESKENIKIRIVDENEDIKQADKEETVTNLEAIAQDALYDLHKLILEGYPVEQCASWLKLIKEKSKKVEQRPQYWECRAALEQARGDINLAVECYKNAIIQGAEVQKVDSCLDQLYQKFNLLSIDESKTVNTEKSKFFEDLKNVFKSNIIQFAVQEKVGKKKNIDGSQTEKKYIATPVRRSTRISRSAFTSTPGVKIYSSLQDVDNSIKQHLNFQCNNALKD